MKRRLKRLQPGHDGFRFIVEQKVREELSPLVFFDAGTHLRNDEGLRIGMHPHSGIGIVTCFEGADLVHDDTEGNAGIIRDGGLQWIRAGSGIWHDENYRKKTESPPQWPLTIHQLWIQLPPALEKAGPAYRNLQPEEMVTVDNVKVIFGAYQEKSAALKVPYEMTYLDVSLPRGEAFTLETPKDQIKGFLFPRQGEIRLWDERIPLNHLGILEPTEGTIGITAAMDSKFVIILSEGLDAPVIAHHGSIHSNRISLERSLRNIDRIGKFFI